MAEFELTANLQCGSPEHMPEPRRIRITQEEIDRRAIPRRKEIERILAIEEPYAKNYHDRKRRDWREQQAEAKAELKAIDQGYYRPPAPWGCEYIFPWDEG